jgi:hypothetical protein
MIAVRIFCKLVELLTNAIGCVATIGSVYNIRVPEKARLEVLILPLNVDS